MSNFALTALCPLDGRYARKVEKLQGVFSEFALIRARVRVELEWLAFLSGLNLPDFPIDNGQIDYIFTLYENFSLEDAKAVKQIESTINHDVKAVEYYIKDFLMKSPETAPLSEWVHIGCTSEDINNIAIALMMKEAGLPVYYHSLHVLLETLKYFTLEYAEIPMLARTHGQPASPTTVGKELANFVKRLEHARYRLQTREVFAKFNGATGNFNAITATYPEYDWLSLIGDFIDRLGLQFNPFTTQIEPHDGLAGILLDISTINTICLDLARDMWGYIALGYFKQKKKEGEVGSSTMPHKVNPIDFENAEGNLGIANALAKHFAEKLPVSRWQRDLSDSTVMRNLGLVFGYSMIAIDALEKGFNKVLPDREGLVRDLENHWEVLAEPIQMVLRRYGIEAPYEKLKALTRGEKVTQDILHQFIDGLNIPPEVKKLLKTLTPLNYTGYAERLARMV